MRLIPRLSSGADKRRAACESASPALPRAWDAHPMDRLARSNDGISVTMTGAACPDPAARDMAMPPDGSIDCHAHVIDPQRFAYADGAGYRPLAARDGNPGGLRRRARRARRCPRPAGTAELLRRRQRGDAGRRGAVSRPLQGDCRGRARHRRARARRPSPRAESSASASTSSPTTVRPSPRPPPPDCSTGYETSGGSRRSSRRTSNGRNSPRSCAAARSKCSSITSASATSPPASIRPAFAACSSWVGPALRPSSSPPPSGSWRGPAPMTSSTVSRRHCWKPSVSMAASGARTGPS